MVLEMKIELNWIIWFRLEKLFLICNIGKFRSESNMMNMNIEELNKWFRLCSLFEKDMFFVVSSCFYILMKYFVLFFI